MTYNNFNDESEDDKNSEYLIDNVDNSNLPIDIYTPQEPTTPEQRLQFLDMIVDKIFEKIESPEQKTKIYFQDMTGIALFFKLYQQKGYKFKQRYITKVKILPHIKGPESKFVNRERRPYIEIIKEPPKKPA